MFWDADGKLCEPVKQPYESLWNEWTEVCGWFFGSEGLKEANFSRNRGLELCVKAMGLNYRYGRNEQSIIRIIDSDNLLNYLAATIDLPKVGQVEDAQKKTESVATPEPENTTPGQPED